MGAEQNNALVKELMQMVRQCIDGGAEQNIW